MFSEQTPDTFLDKRWAGYHLVIDRFPKPGLVNDKSFAWNIRLSRWYEEELDRYWWHFNFNNYNVDLVTPIRNANKNGQGK